MKENNVEDLPELIFIDEIGGNMRVDVHEGGSTESRKNNIKLVKLPIC